MWKKIAGKLNYWLAHFAWEKTDSGNVETVTYKCEKPFFEETPALKDPVINASYTHSNQQWDHHEYIKICKGRFFIDPLNGVLLDEKNKILSDSIVVDHKALYPAFLTFNKDKRTHLTNLPEAVVFDYHKGRNYFHFYSDVLGKAYMIREELPQVKNYPLLVSEAIYKTRHFQFFSKLKPLSEFKWRVQKEHEIIEAATVCLLQPMPYDMKYWHWIRSITADFRLPQQPGKKIFINRPPTTGRHISNYEEIHQLVKEHGFEIADMENKSIEEQIALFSSASHIISIHGAGLTNLLFCHEHTNVLEIMPNERISAHYFWLSRRFGLNYECILGGNLKQHRIFYPKGKFYLDPVKMKKYLEEWATEV